MLEEGLHWPIRRSFARYVAGLADGRLAVSNGAKPTEKDELFFPLQAGQVPPHELSFDGIAHFSGHFGMLSVRIARPSLSLRADHAGGLLKIGGTESTIDLAIFALEREEYGDHVVMRGRDVRLTASAAPLFGGAYAAQDLLDDFLVILPKRDSR